MVMDSPWDGFPDPFSSFKFNDETDLPSFEQQSQNVNNGLNFEETSLNFNFVENYVMTPSPEMGSFGPSTSGSTDADSSEDHDSDPVLKFLNQILLEENMEEKPSMFHDPLALQAAEKSFYEVIGEKYPHAPSPYLQSQAYFLDANAESNSENGTTTSRTTSGNLTDPQWSVDPGDHKPSVVQPPLFDSSLQSSWTDSKSSVHSANGSNGNTNGQVDPFANTNLFTNIFSNSESILQFQKGMEEARKFLPPDNQLIIDLDKYELPPKSDEETPKAVVKVEKDERDHFPSYAKGKKHLHRQDSELEEQRSSKQLAVYEEDVDLSEMFDRVLLCTEGRGVSEPAHYQGEVDKTLQQNGSGKARTKKQFAKNDTVDIRTLLVSCAQSVASDDRRTANEQLKQIRQHSSPTGDACERLANIFANGIEARLAGNGTQVYASLASKRISAAEKLKAYQVYLSACPYKKIAIAFANKMIMGAAAKASTLHIVDFGISYGFQWPLLIQQLSLSLSNRPGGTFKLRITGIEFPQAGFRPAELIEETGRRLSKYCERYKVPFEYQAIATQSWETIKIEELKLARDEVVAVNSLCRFKNLLDETVVVDSPRDGVLQLIKKMKPDIFVNSVVNGSYSAPFFVTRFREALFYYSALFDMLDVTLPRDNKQRLNFEGEFYGREVVNVIACEGPERVERPETYKQWQIRNLRAGFKPLPLNQEIMNKLKNKVNTAYHKDFVFDEDGSWMLQGWKGRILYGSSCWVLA